MKYTRVVGEIQFTEINNHAGVIRDSEFFERRLQLINRGQFENQTLAARSGDIGYLNELRTGNVCSLIFLLVAHMEEHERFIVEMFGQPGGRDDHRIAHPTLS